MNHRTVSATRGLLRIEQRITTRRLEIGTDVSGATCIYGYVQVARGGVSYLHGDGRIRAPK